MRFKFILSAFIIGFLTFGAFPVMAEGDGLMKERIREKLKERIAAKAGATAAGGIIAKAGSASATETTDTRSPITQAGDYIFSIQHDGLTRQYLVHVPPTYNPRQSTALLMAFHGGGGGMKYQSNDENYGLISKANREGFIVIFPNGYSKFKSGMLATWNAGNCCGDARDKNVDDVGFVRQIVANITSQMNIDKNSIYATGMSNGGMMSYRLACEMSDVFTAIAAVAGTDGTHSCPHANPISVLHIHAQDDTHVLFNGGAGQDAFRDISKVAEFTSVPDTIKRWVGYNGCSAKPQRVLNVSGAYCDLYSGCRNGTEVKLCVTETGGHSWPGGGDVRGKTTSKAISANDMMWDFFQNQR